MNALMEGVVTIALWMGRGLPLPKPTSVSTPSRPVPLAFCLAGLAWLAWFVARSPKLRNLGAETA